jgi:hypothetical protein
MARANPIPAWDRDFDTCILIGRLNLTPALSPEALSPNFCPWCVVPDLRVREFDAIAAIVLRGIKALVCHPEHLLERGPGAVHRRPDAHRKRRGHPAARTSRRSPRRDACGHHSGLVAIGAGTECPARRNADAKSSSTPSLGWMRTVGAAAKPTPAFQCSDELAATRIPRSRPYFVARRGGDFVPVTAKSAALPCCRRGPPSAGGLWGRRNRAG